jgi:hypothetical protein
LAEQFERRRGTITDRIKFAPREGNRGIPAQGSLYRLNCLGRSPLVAMMQTSHLREFNNISHLGRLNGPRFRGVFGQP